MSETHTHSHDDAQAQPHVHATHPAIVKRLKRANGHLLGIIEMIESQRPCLDIAQQLHAVEKAVQQAKKTLIQDHLDHCLDGVVGAKPADQRRAIDDFREITKYL
jgi:DNA-binding FrmR family transcriptional regulator